MLKALSRFDDEFRHQGRWLEWETNPLHHYALERNGVRYPVKKVLSLASGVPATAFSGGKAANDYLRSIGLEVVALRGTVDELSAP